MDCVKQIQLDLSGYNIKPYLIENVTDFDPPIKTYNGFINFFYYHTPPFKKFVVRVLDKDSEKLDLYLNRFK